MSADESVYLIAYLQFYKGEAYKSHYLLKIAEKLLVQRFKIDYLRKNTNGLQYHRTYYKRKTLIPVITLCSILLHQLLVLTLLWMKMGL